MQAKAQQNKTDKNVCWKPGSECIQFFFVFHQTLQTEGFESQKNLTNLDVSTVDTILGPWRPPTRAPAGGGRTSPGGGGGCDISTNTCRRRLPREQASRLPASASPAHGL